MPETIYVVIKCARDPAGEVVFGTTEKAFRNAEDAKKFIADQGPVIWEETIQGFNCYCERALHTVELV